MDYINIESEALWRSLELELDHGPPFTKEEVAGILEFTIMDDLDESLLTLMPQVTSLYYSDWNGREIGDVSALPRLDKVVVLDCHLSSLRGLSSATGDIREIYISSSKMGSLSGLKGIRSLRKLTVKACELDDLNGLEGCDPLERLVLRRCTLRSLRGIEGLVNLEELILEDCLQESLDPLFELLRRKNEAGQFQFRFKPSHIPREEYNRLGVLLEEELPNMRVTGLADTFKVLREELGQRLMDAGYPVVGLHYHKPKQGVATMSVKYAGIPPVHEGEELNDWTQCTVSFLEEVLAGPKLDNIEFWLKVLEDAEVYKESRRKPPSPPPFPWRKHEEEGSAKDARRWVEESEGLSERERAVLLDFISRFPDETFVRVDDAYLDALAQKSVPPPSWLRRILTTLAWIERRLVTTDAEDDMLSMWVGDGYDQKDLGEVQKFYAIGTDKGHYMHGVNLEDENDRRVYAFYSGDSLEEDHITQLGVRFSHYLDIFTETYAIAYHENGELKFVEQKHPPKVTEGHQRGS